MGVEEHLAGAFKLIKSLQPQHVVVDAISACNRMGSEQQGFDYLFRLMSHCKTQGITCLLVNQGNVFIDTMQGHITDANLSSLIDTVIFLRYIEVGGEINRMLLVAKSRGTKHSNQYREYMITDNGIEVFDVYLGKGGVLTGVARQEQEAAELAAFKKQQELVELEKLEIIGDELVLKQTMAAMESKLEARRKKLAIMLEDEQIKRTDRHKRSDMRDQDGNSVVSEQDRRRQDDDEQ